MVNIKTLAQDLNDYSASASNDALSFEVQPLPGDVEVLQILVEEREELPIFISVAEHEILCLSYLFTQEEVKADAKAQMHEAMLSMNIPMPLSSFATIGNQYVAFGSLSASSDIDTVVHEIEVLSENTLEAITALTDYLK